MKESQGFQSLLFGGVAAVVMVATPAMATTVITDVKVNPAQSGVQLFLQTPAGEKPQVFAVNRGNRWTADITNAKLNLAGGNNFSQINPTSGIASINVTPLDANSVRVTVVGEGAAPVGQIARPANGGIAFNFVAGNGAQAPAPAPNTQAQAPGSPMVPNPEVNIQGGTPFAPVVPPSLPRAIAPPVGDIAATQIDSSAPFIDLGTSERVPRLVLRDAPAREVLSLLARAAGMNLAFTINQSGDQQQQQQQQQQGQANEGPRITLDIENEPIQNVFNYVLQMTGLDANRIGRTIFVGTKLPNSARNVVVRSVRLNQASVTSALNFLVTLGAESAVSRDRLVTSVNAVPVAGQQIGGQSASITQSQTTTEARVETQRVDFKDSTPLLRGLQVTGDERTNQVTLIGEPKKVEIALAQLTQLDVRRRQAVVNVRVIDINLLALDRISASFSFGVDRYRFSVDQGGLLFNFGNRSPANNGLGGNGINRGTNLVGGSPIQNFLGTSGDIAFNRAFFGQLQSVISTGNGKILTDPSLLVQEGQTATVNLTEEVITNLKQEVTRGGDTSTVTVTVEKGRAGLILGIKVDRIDDNGFVSMSVAPSVSSVAGQETVSLPGGQNASITLLAERRLESGQIRLRDNQTLVLSGIIQDQDRTLVTKTPLLGDIPLLGALFRKTERQNQRREVIVLVTPRILDDSDRSSSAFNGYTPGPDAQQMINRSNPTGP